VDGARALELVGRHAPADAERPEAPFRLGHGLASSRAARLHYELLALLRRGMRTLELDDVVAELADETLAAAYRTHGIEARRRPPSTSAGRRRRDLAEAAKLAVNERLESLPSLGELARALGCSPFHLSRTFHRATGVSLRDYVRRLRTRRAADRLAAGARDLAGLAVELGYADHSHFTNAFREEWGLPPAGFRERQRLSSRPPRNILQASRPIGT
jgi:AraC-like DNA-binding protein